jgi:hypothetical protein
LIRFSIDRLREEFVIAAPGEVCMPARGILEE